MCDSSVHSLYSLVFVLVLLYLCSLCKLSCILNTVYGENDHELYLVPDRRLPLCFQENGRRQKSKLCETFDHLFALLEERKGEMILRISSEQEEKLDYIRGLRGKHTEHLENAAKLLETAIQTLDESEMAVFLQVNLNAP